MANHTTISKLRRTIKKPKVFKVGVIMVSLSILLFLSTFFAPSLSQFTSGDVERLQATITKKEEQLKAIASLWLKDKSLSQAKAFEILNPKLNEKLEQDNLSVYLFDSTSLVGWSRIPTFCTRMVDSLPPKLKLVRFNDSWNLVATFKSKGKRAMIAIEIQKNFKINNRFLENSFNHILGIPSNFSIVSKGDTTSNGNLYVVKINQKPSFELFSKKDSSTNKATKDFFYFLSLLIFILGSWPLIVSFGFGRRSVLFFISLSILCMIDVVLIKMMESYAPEFYYFSPSLYSSDIASSLGVLSTYILILGIFCSVAYYHYVDYKIPKKAPVKLYAWGLALFMAGLVALCNFIIYSLINDSSISFGILKISEFSRYSIIAYMSIALLIICVILIVSLYVRLFRDLSSRYKLLGLLIPTFGVGLIQSLFLNPVVVAVFVAAATTTCLIFIYGVKAYGRVTIGYLSLMMVLWAISASIAILDYAIAKDKMNRAAFAESLYNENDPIVEAMLPELTQRLKEDTLIADLVHNPASNNDSISSYIRNNYMNGYLNRYNLVLTICPENANLYLANENKTTSCQRYFDNLLHISGLKVPGSSFFYIRNSPGQISYMGQVDYKLKGKRTSMYVEFDVKTINNNPGYPELLLRKAFVKNHGYDMYDYAHYVRGVLVAKNGNFSYPSIITPPSIRQKSKNAPSNGYVHLYYRFDKDNTLVISRPKLRVFDIASGFSYIFIFLAFLGLLIFKRSRLPLDDSLSYKTFKGRITTSFILVLTVALILTAFASLIYGVIRFDTNKQQAIKDKMKSATPSVLSALNYPNLGALTSELIRISNYLYADVNIYNTAGDLTATSRQEIFDDGLQGFKMNSDAYRKLAIEHESFYVHQENIGHMNFTSSYSPIFDNDGKLRGYVNLPYFLQYNDLRRELYTILIATANIFIFLLLPVILIAVLISKSITRPLALIRDRMRIFDLKTNPEPIPYLKNDEIGDLIAEFNKMINQVEESAEKLAHSERDSAWREMARQIAHEIKNPLTPMKLSLQYLVMMKSKNDPRWLEQFDRYAISQIEQIESLAKIASEFSDFAKISFDEKTPIFDLRELLHEVLPMYDGYPHLTMKFDEPAAEMLVQIDREHMRRVVVNLLKNAIQSFEKDAPSLIHITVSGNVKHVQLSVRDNGKGIDEEIKKKIFTPNFTTKSSGSGLGLAISKNLVETYNGRIWFNSQLEVGTTFYVELPRVKQLH